MNYLIDLRSDGQGTYYTTAKAAGSDLLRHWVVRRSQDRGQNWEVLDDFLGTGNLGASALSVLIDTLGDVYVGGWEFVLGSNRGAVIRRLVP